MVMVMIEDGARAMIVVVVAMFPRTVMSVRMTVIMTL